MKDALNEKAARMSLAVAIVVWLIGCGSSSTAVGPIEPVPPVSTVTAPLPWVYSQIFSSSSPFHTSVDTLLANGAVKLPQSAMASLWSQGVANQDLSPTSWMFPVYVSSASDPVKSFNCTKWGACNANGMKIHVPPGAMPEPQDDGHIGIIDTALGIEVDGWQCAVTATDVNCSWGGKYANGGNGIENSGSNAVHGGYAAGASVISAQELLNGRIDHALAMTVTCLNNPTVYPADQNTSGSDNVCADAAAPSYGALVHLLWTPSRIAASTYSAECKTVLTALATYGAYTNDTGNGGLAVLTQHQLSYTAIGKDSPWATTILPHMAASGDSSGTYWHSSLNRLSASDFELLQIKPGTY